MTTITTDQLVSDIDLGYYDTDLDKLKAAVAGRERLLRTVRTKDDFMIGDRVVLNEQCGTKYLQGKTATVVAMKRTKVVIVLDRPVGRFVQVDADGRSHSPNITVPTSIIDPAPKDKVAM